jgi:hypothetical protein
MANHHLTIDTTALNDRDALADAVCCAIENGPCARQVARQSANVILSTVPSHKMAREFEAESGIEGIAIQYADVGEDVAVFGTQRVEVIYDYNGRVRRGYPDVAIQYLDGSVGFWEIKPERNSSSLVGRLGALRASLMSCGIRYDVLTPFKLEREPRLSNIRQLHRQGSRPLPPSFRSLAQAVFRASPLTNIGMLRKAVGCDIGDVFGAIAQGLIAADMDLYILGDLTQVRMPRLGARSGAFFLDDRG